jgi:peptidoglycan/LPS O-acetylase OafA/YrhL
LPNVLPGRWAEFALGMLAAELYRKGSLGAWSRRLRYGLIILLPASVLAVGDPLSHLLFGAVFFVVLGLALTDGGLLNRVFSWPPLVRVGVMSYSLYLVHQPLIQALAHVLRTDAQLTPRATFVALVLLLPLVFLATALLFFGVEQWTLTSQPSARLVEFPASARRAVFGLKRQARIAASAILPGS